MIHKRFRLFFYLLTSTILLLLFQNFSFIRDKGRHSLERFLPGYQAHEKMMGMEVPHGYKEYVGRQIASKGRRIIFDERRLLKDTVENSPVYKEIKDILDPASIAEDSCSTNPADGVNNCFAVSENSGPVEQSPDMRFKIKGNPLRGVAGVGMSGPFESAIKYDQKNQNVVLEINGKISNDTKIKFEAESQSQQGKVQIDMSW